MRLSYRWLDELVGLKDLPADTIARRLTFHTAEVEGVETVGEGLAGVVTGRVVAVRPHPDADRLRLCTVDLGDGTTPEVVCGAPNVAEGQVVCYARVGLTLPNGVKLKKAKIRGVESVGMICAEDELGLGEGHAGIIELPEGTPIGVPVAQVLGADDEVFVIDNPAITHRPDLWGHVGYARELGALLGERFTPPTADDADQAFADATGEPFPIRIEDEDGCRRYVGVVIENVSNGPSPWWLRTRLEALGMRSISLLVDLSNYVMLEQGQPIHAFDIRDIQGGGIVVRRARPGETMTTLDGEERTFVEDDLLIADGERAVAVAGVMGGENSEVREDTTTLLLEAANFDPVRVRLTAARLGLRTEASSRFEKRLDPESAWAAARRFTQLVLEHCPGATVTRRVADAYPRPYPAVRIEMPYDLVSRRLGMRISDGEVRANLMDLGFEVHEERDVLQVDVPSWRATKDVECAEDLVEEAGRIHGYDHVPETAPVGKLTPTLPPPLRRLERRMGDVLSLDLGYAETKTYAFYGPTDAARVGLGDVAHLHVSNPITEEQDRMILTTVPGLLRQVLRNIVREPSGRMWVSNRLTVPRDASEGLPTESPVLGLVSWNRDAETDAEGHLFRDLIADVRAALAAAPVGEVVLRDGTGEPLRPGLPGPLWQHPGRRALIAASDTAVAVAGEVSPAVLRAFDLPGRVACAEIDLDAVLGATTEKGALYRPIHRYPVVPFDVAVIVDRKTPAADVADAIAGVDKTAVRDVALFDVYEGQGIPDGSRSLAFRLELLDPKGTLTTKKADKLRRRIVGALEKNGWTVRTGDDVAGD